VTGNKLELLLCACILSYKILYKEKHLTEYILLAASVKLFKDTNLLPHQRQTVETTANR